MSVINPFFHANYYLARNPDLVRAGLYTDQQLWEHYIQYGAQESAIVSSRSPTNWFDVNYYLAMYPDVLAGGVNSATALDHYTQYGLWEDREVNAIFSIHDFSYQAYANANRDLQVTFVIDDADALTAQQKQLLFGHYLQYGFREDRDGAQLRDNNPWAQLVTKKLIIHTNTGRYIGTIGDDEFHVLAGSAYGQTINGLGGDDTVLLQKNLTTNTLQDLHLRQVEQLKIEGVYLSTLVADHHLQHVEIRNEVTDTTMQGVELSVLNPDKSLLPMQLDIQTGVVDVVLNHVDQVLLGVPQQTASDVSLGMNQLQASHFQLVVHDQLLAQKDSISGALQLTLRSDWSPSLSSYEVDARALSTDFRFFIQGQLDNVAQRTMYLGQGENALAAVKAVESIHMGVGASSLLYLSPEQAVVRVAEKRIVEMDSIFGFKQGDAVYLPVGQSVSAHVFQTGQLGGDKSLEQLVFEVGAGKVFQWQNDSYVVLQAGGVAS